MTPLVPEVIVWFVMICSPALVRLLFLLKSTQPFRYTFAPEVFVTFTLTVADTPRINSVTVTPSSSLVLLLLSPVAVAFFSVATSSSVAPVPIKMVVAFTAEEFVNPL